MLISEMINLFGENVTYEECDLICILNCKYLQTIVIAVRKTKSKHKKQIFENCLFIHSQHFRKGSMSESETTVHRKTLLFNIKHGEQISKVVSEIITSLLHFLQRSTPIFFVFEK